MKLERKDILLALAAVALGLAIGIIFMMRRSDPPPPPNKAAEVDKQLAPLIDMAAKYTAHLEREVERLHRLDSIERVALNKTTDEIKKIQQRRAALPDRADADNSTVRDFFANLPPKD